MGEPVVSVVLPTYNREALLPRAIDSVIAQTFTDWELIVIDDGSTDGTERLAARYQQRLGDRFRFLRQGHDGCGPARNRGIDAARGRFLALLDSDDEYLPRKLERQLALFEMRPELGLVYADYAYVDLEGMRHESVFDTLSPLAREVPCEEVAPGLCVCTQSLFDYLIRAYFVATIVGMVRREVLGDSIRWRPVPSYAEEWLFFLKVARVCRAGFVREPLCVHHFTSGSITRSDAHRNTVRLQNLLRAMPSVLAPLARRHRRIIHRHLARAAEQLGYDAFRQRAYIEARRQFIESFRNAPRPRMLYHAAHAAVRSVFPAAAAG